MVVWQVISMYGGEELPRRMILVNCNQDKALFVFFANKYLKIQL